MKKPDLLGNRIERKFEKLRKLKRAAFIPYICAGDPNPEITKKLALEFDSVGVDIVELGVPFSDPIADGPSIQKASERALAHKISLKQIIEMVKELRKYTEIPIALMTYFNPVFIYGIEKFCNDATDAGVDGVIIPDLTPEEAGPLFEAAKKVKFATILLVAPTTPPERMKLIAENSTGFIYCVAVTGVTGARDRLSEFISPMVSTLRKYTDKPICVGFGVSNPEQARAVAKIADAVIVGSAIIDVMEANLEDEAKLIAETKQFVSSLVDAVVISNGQRG